MSDALPAFGIEGQCPKIQGRRPSFDRILFLLSAALLVFGSMLMCVFAFSVLLAIGSRYYGSSLIQLLSIVLVLGGLALTFDALKAKIEQKARMSEVSAKWAEAAVHGKPTNQTILKPATTS